MIFRVVLLLPGVSQTGERNKSGSQGTMAVSVLGLKSFPQLVGILDNCMLGSQ